MSLFGICVTSVWIHPLLNIPVLMYITYWTASVDLDLKTFHKTSLRGRLDWICTAGWCSFPGSATTDSETGRVTLCETCCVAQQLRFMSDVRILHNIKSLCVKGIRLSGRVQV